MTLAQDVRDPAAQSVTGSESDTFAAPDEELPAELQEQALQPSPGGPVLEALPPPPPPEPTVWPGIDSLALALAQPDTRHETLLTVAALLALPRRAPVTGREAAHLRARELLSNLEWIQTLEGRYGIARPRSPALDPAAWQVQAQLDRVGLVGSLLSSPLGPGADVLTRQVLDRKNPSLAAAALPELLWDLEVEAPLAWQGLLRRLDEDPWLSAALMEQGGELFAWPKPAVDEQLAITMLTAASADPVTGAGATTESDPGPGDLLLREAMQSVSVMLALASGVGPPDDHRLMRLRFSLLTAMPGLDLAQRAEADALLHIASLLHELHAQEYFVAVEGLLAVAASLENYAAWYPERAPAFAAWFSELFTVISEVYGRQLALVDPELNATVAATYDVVQALARGSSAAQRVGLRVALGDAVAKLSLLIPDLGFYFDQPIRDPVAGGVDACTGKAGQLEDDGSPSMTRDLFDDCQATLLGLADMEAREAQLAGSMDGPFGPSQLRRELGLTAGQRINYGIGYLNDRYDTGCPLPDRPLPNPLEWAYLATFMAWFAEQSPIYFKTPENEVRLARMKDIGNELLTVITEQVDCLAGAGAAVNDPVERIASDYQAELREMARGLESAREAFRARILKPGADLRLEGDANQSTAYRPVDLTIGPCDVTQVCEMAGTLSSTRALTGLFEDEFLLADQAGLGSLEICYDNMGWIDRRSEPVRPDDDNVANYYGRLAFDLRGRFSLDDEVFDLFAFRFATHQESHYLFSAASDEVLGDACPVEWVGTRIVTGLPEGGPRIVPDRLTYLSAARTLPSRLLETNWDKGEEWRDRFVTGLGVERLALPPPPDISAALNQRLEALYRQERATLYGVLTGDGDGANLSAELEDLSTFKLLLGTQMMLFYPQTLMQSDTLRGAITGQQGLLDRRLVTRARQQEIPVDELLESADAGIQSFRKQWGDVPEAVRRQGSVSDSVAHGLLRLKAINEQFFASPLAPLDNRSAPLTRPEDQASEEQAAEQEL